MTAADGGPDEPVRRLLERIAAPAAAPRPAMEEIGAALAALAADADYWAPRIAGVGEVSGAVPVHGPPRGPRLQLVHRLEGQVSAIHDHGTWIALAAITGLETHRRYRRPPPGSDAMPGVDVVEEVGPAGVVTLLAPDDVHDHGHISGRGRPAWILVLSGDDQRAFTRHEWDVLTGCHRLLLPGEPGRWLSSEPMP